MRCQCGHDRSEHLLRGNRLECDAAIGYGKARPTGDGQHFMVPRVYCRCRDFKEFAPPATKQQSCGQEGLPKTTSQSKVGCQEAQAPGERPGREAR